MDEVGGGVKLVYVLGSEEEIVHLHEPEYVLLRPLQVRVSTSHEEKGVPVVVVLAEEFNSLVDVRAGIVVDLHEPSGVGGFVLEVFEEPTTERHARAVVPPEGIVQKVGLGFVLNEEGDFRPDVLVFQFISVTVYEFAEPA